LADFGYDLALIGWFGYKKGFIFAGKSSKVLEI
jgi:hypothetical protein